jgi:cell division protein FtsL
VTISRKDRNLKSAQLGNSLNMEEKKTQIEELLEKISRTEEILANISKNLEDRNKLIETDKEGAISTRDSRTSEPKVNETKPGETKSKKTVSRSFALALGIICIVLVASLVGEMLYTTSLLNEKNGQIDSLNTQIMDQNSTISSLNSQVSQLSTEISDLNTTIFFLSSQISQLNATVSNPLNQSEPYIQSQLLAYPPTNITANSRIEDWILNWTPTTDIRIIKIQVWMGNPQNVVWEGDTFVTVGKPSDPWNSSSYTDTIQLLVHYQFDSHAPSATPDQIMFDLTPGFKVASGQTINVYRLFMNTELYTVNAGDVQVIIYYENT